MKVIESQYFSLMTAIADILPITGFGLCSGMGSCGLAWYSLMERMYFHVNLLSMKAWQDASIYVNEA